MADNGTTRRLAAIVSTDVAGYSRLMGADEEGTLAALKRHRRELIDPAIDRHRGRIVKTTGDGMLLEFPSVVDALRCCLEVQRDMLERNQAVPDERQIRFRVGVNLGDVIVDGDDIFGDGVNIAARLEAMAAPGGLCISHSVLEQVQQKMKLDAEDLGERALKNIEKPVHAYRVVQGGHLPGAEHPPAAPAAAPTDSGITLPQRPSLAILPFRNLNADAESDFVADGIGLGIQTLLVQLSGLFLINASSDKGYRAGRLTAAGAVRGLPVRYVLEGTVQRAGQRVRVSVRLTDLHDGTLVWADRYDRDLEDVFALQDDVTREVINSLHIELLGRNFEHIVTRDLAGNGAWEYFLRGVSHIYKFTKADNARAREMFERLHRLQPAAVQGASYLALSHWLDATRGWTAAGDSLRQAAEWAAKAVGYEDNDGLGHVIMSDIRLREGRHDEALAWCEKAVELRTSCPAALGQIAKVQLYCGDARGAVRNARESLAVRTMYPPMNIIVLAAAYRDAGDIASSIPAAREAARLDPADTDSRATLCSDHVLAGDEEEARRIAQEIVAIDPEFRTSHYAGRHPYRDPATLARVVEALRAAGLPE